MVMALGGGMPRPLRFEYEGALYHVINRGNYRSWIFEDDGAKGSFEKCLFEACERSGWTLHAFCVMSNHFHLALETPEGNLSDGMKWLQGVFATRYNRYRNERGHLFQGRYKSIVLEDGERLSKLCHYIHLNPVRAGIVDCRSLRSYRYASYWYLRNKRKRPSFLSFESCLDGCGGLRDTPAGREKYGEYLAWLSEDEPRQKALEFDRMSKGWAHGTKTFKKSLLEEREKESAQLELGETGSSEAAAIRFEVVLDKCLKILGKTKADCSGERKSADWKVAICLFMRRRSLCRNAWLANRLEMGAEGAVSNYVSQANRGERKGAMKLFRQLERKTL